MGPTLLRREPQGSAVSCSDEPSACLGAGSTWAGCFLLLLEWEPQVQLHHLQGSVQNEHAGHLFKND